MPMSNKLLEAVQVGVVPVAMAEGGHHNGGPSRGNWEQANPGCQVKF